MSNAQGHDYIISEWEKYSGEQFDPEIAKIRIDWAKEARTQKQDKKPGN